MYLNVTGAIYLYMFELVPFSTLAAAGAMLAPVADAISIFKQSDADYFKIFSQLMSKIRRAGNKVLFEQEVDLKLFSTSNRHLEGEMPRSRLCQWYDNGREGALMNGI